MSTKSLYKLLQSNTTVSRRFLMKPHLTYVRGLRITPTLEALFRN